MKFPFLIAALLRFCVVSSSNTFDDRDELFPFLTQFDQTAASPATKEHWPSVDAKPDRDVQTVDARDFNTFRPSTDALQAETVSYEALRDKLRSSSHRHAQRNATLSIRVNSRFMMEFVKSLQDYLFTHGLWRSMIRLLLPDSFRNIPLPGPFGQLSLHDLTITKFTRPHLDLELKEDGLHVRAYGSELEATLSVHYKGLKAHGIVRSNETSFYGIFTPYFQSPCSFSDEGLAPYSDDDSTESSSEASAASSSSSSSSEQDCSRKHLRIAAHQVRMRFEHGLKSHVYPHVIAPLANRILRSGRVERGLARLLESVIVDALQDNLSGITGDVLGSVARGGLSAVDDLLFGVFKQRLFLNETVHLKHAWLDLFDGEMVMATADPLISTENWKPEVLSPDAFDFYFKTKRKQYIRHWKDAARQHGIPVHQADRVPSFWHRLVRPWLWFKKPQLKYKTTPIDPDDEDLTFSSAMLRSYYDRKEQKKNATRKLVNFKKETLTEKHAQCDKWLKCKWKFCGWMFRQYCVKTSSRLQKRSEEMPPLEIYNDILEHAEPDFERLHVIYA